MIERLISRGDCVWDIGAHHGYCTLIASRVVGPDGAVVSFEPVSTNRWYLEQHVAWSRTTRVDVHSCALGDRDAASTIGGPGSSVSMAVGKGTEPIQLRSASSLVHQGVPVPSFVKIDVEGFEGTVLRGGRGVFGRKSMLLVSIHSRGAYLECAKSLHQDGFSLHLSRVLRANLDGSNSRWHGDPDLVAVGAERGIPIDLLSEFEFEHAAP